MKNSKSIFDLFFIVTLAFCGIISFVFLTPKAQTSDFPVVVRSVAPTVPAVAMAVHANGKVTVDLSLNSKGEVKTANTVKGHPLLRKATEDAALQWKFAPANEMRRDLQLVFDYSLLRDDGIITVIVSPYQFELKAKLPERPRPPETISYIPLDWQPETDKCEIHGKLFERDRVEIIYGLTILRKGYLEAEQKLFPHANIIKYGGCVIENDALTEGQTSPTSAEVLYCPKCRLAHKKWSLENRNKPFN